MYDDENLMTMMQIAYFISLAKNMLLALKGCKMGETEIASSINHHPISGNFMHDNKIIVVA